MELWLGTKCTAKTAAWLGPAGVMAFYLAGQPLQCSLYVHAGASVSDSSGHARDMARSAPMLYVKLQGISFSANLAAFAACMSHHERPLLLLSPKIPCPA